MGVVGVFNSFLALNLDKCGTSLPERSFVCLLNVKYDEMVEAHLQT